MKPYNPSGFAEKMHPEMLKWSQSVHQVLTAGVDMGTPSGCNPQDGSVNAGVYTKFERGNSSGILYRVNASDWDGSGAIVIHHGLLHQPIGFKIVDKDKTVDVFRTAPPTTDTITLQATDPSASVTLYIF